MNSIKETTKSSSARADPSFNVQHWRQDFPILKQTVHRKPLVYLDNAATTQKPLSVIESESRYYATLNANVHRGVHDLSQRATSAFEAAREKVRTLINAASTEEIVFVRGATEAINLVAYSYGQSHIKTGDEIVVTEMEHHSNIVPWQILCERSGAVLRVAPIDDAGELIMEKFEAAINERTKIVAVTHVSNALGTINPLHRIIEKSHAAGAVVLIDGAQAGAHLRIDVQRLDCDFYALSGHKLYGPTGIGVLYGKAALLDAMPPYQSGGDMISQVTFKKTRYNALPYKFEAGTPNIAGAIGFGAAIDYIDSKGLDAIAAHEHALLDYATRQAKDYSRMHIIGTAREKASILAFVIEDMHPHDIGTILDYEGIAIRTGHNCAMPVMDHFHIPATARASFAMYNTFEEIDVLFEGIVKAMKMFGVR